MSMTMTMQRYGLAKAAVNCYSLELARRCVSDAQTCHVIASNFSSKRLPKITVSSCTPGYIATDLTKNFLGGKTAKEAGMKTPAEVIFNSCIPPGVYRS